MTYTPDQIADAIITEGQTARTAGTPETLHPAISPRGIQIALSTAIVETNERDLANPNVPESENYPNDGDGTDHSSAGEFQQQYQWWGTIAEEMDPRLSAAMFYHHLAGMNYNDLNTSPGTFAQDVQQSAYPDRYDQHFADAVAQYNRLTGTPPPQPVTPAVAPPVFTEDNQIGTCPNFSPRDGTTVDLFIIHTEEGGGSAQDLANFLTSTADGSNPVSYHYSIDNSVTVIDVGDTDLESWSVLNANARSIDLCFAGSYVAWTRQEWLDNMGNAIDVAAYLAVQDCNKYGIQIRVIAPPYNSDPPGITDHKYVTQWLGDGTHVDVGNNFPWDVFTAAVTKYSTGIDGDDPLSDPAVVQMITDIHTELFKQGPSRSFLAPDGTLLETMLGFDYNTDGNAWNDVNVWAYFFGVSYAVENVERVAAGGVAPNSWAGSQPFVAQYGQEFCKGLVDFKVKLLALLNPAPKTVRTPKTV